MMMQPDDKFVQAVTEDNELDQDIERLCSSKAEEFKLLGYDAVNGKDIWLCVSDKYSKIGTPQLHEMVNDILSLKVTQYMNWITMRMYKGL
ncbi:post-transcriptional regulator [Paenibacillus albiflavus]